MSADALPDEILQRFRQVAAERLGRAESLWFSLVQGTGHEEHAAELHRLIHTLKGDAQLVRYADVELVCHKLEDLLAVARALAYAVPDELELLVTMSFHFIGLLARKRVGTSVAGIDLDGFVQEVELVVRAAQYLERRGAGPRGPGASPDDPALDADQATRLARAATLAFVEALGQRLRAPAARHPRLRQLWRALRLEVSLLRATPLQPLVERHARAANELADQLGKLVDVVVETEPLHVSARVADALDVGLLHCVRNAIDHGIEPPDERVAADKPRRGTLRLVAHTRGDVVELEIEDDGRGLHREALLQRARAVGLIEPVPATTVDVNELAFRPGLSTARATSPVSGRGVGLDAVRSALRTVGGEASVHSRADGGTRLVLRVSAPRHHVQVHVLEVRAGVRLAIPAQWTITLEHASGPEVIDPLVALDLAPPSSDPPSHVLRLRWGAHGLALAAASPPRLATAERICPTATTDPMEVVRIGEHEVLLLRPEHLPKNARRDEPSE